MFTFLHNPGAVENLQVDAVTDHMLDVSWYPPFSPNGVIVGYEVVVRNLINSDENAYNISKNVNNTNISDGIGNILARSRVNID